MLQSHQTATPIKYYKRHLISELEKWNSKEHRKPLLIRGARQVGKSTLVQAFSTNFKYFINLNLEKKADVRYFDIYNEVRSIKEALFLDYNIPNRGISSTLLFIDEIQESPAAIQMLRYFYEEFPELRVIGAGSLLEHNIHKIKSFPVGRVENLYLHPFNFSEYLEAIGNNALIEHLNTTPLSPLAHQSLRKAFHEYALIGGMPEVVRSYLKHKSLSDLSRIYDSIWLTYKEDIEKYAKNDTEKRVLKHILNVAHLYIDQRIKFQNFGNSNYKSREVGKAFRHLNEARVIQLIYPSTSLQSPIITDYKKSPRLQFLDTGIVNSELNIQAQLLEIDDLNEAYKGAIIPHLIIQELISLGVTKYNQPAFWVRQKRSSDAEVDIILSTNNKIIPIEVKSGKEGKLKSLHQFIEAVDHPYAIRMYDGPFRIDQNLTPTHKKPYLLMNLPYYLGTRLPEYIDFFIKNHKL